MSEKRSLNELHPKYFIVPLLILAAGGMLAAGLELPILTVRKLWKHNTFSVITGIRDLYEAREYFLSGVIFFFSFVFPITKLVLLFLIWMVRVSERTRKHLLLGLLTFGKWSMLDVFIVAIMIVSVRLGVLADAKPERGIFFFAGSVLLSMVITEWMRRLALRN